LTDTGIFCGWINEPVRIPLTAATVFPNLIKFPGVIIAAKSPIEFDLQFMQKVFEAYITEDSTIIQTDIEDNLDPVNIMELRSVPREMIIERVEDIPILTDMNPWLEYYYLREPVR
jgi:hypothetical protein